MSGNTVLAFNSHECNILSHYRPFRVKISQKMPVKYVGTQVKNGQCNYLNMHLGTMYVMFFCVAQSLF